MTAQTRASGSRQQLPPNALKVCASCGAQRGNRTNGWTPITRAKSGEVIGWTCADCPAYSEPIRREVSGGRVRFLAVVGSATGADGKRHQLTDPETGKRRQLKQRFAELAAARRWVAEQQAGIVRSAAEGRAHVDPSRFTVRQLADAWLAERQKDRDAGELRTVSLNGYRSALSSALGIIGDRPAREVTIGEVRSMLRTLASQGGRWGRPLSHRSLVYALGTLRLVFGHAIERGWVLTDPTARVTAPKGRDTSQGRAAARWEPAEVIRFRAHLDRVYAAGSEALDREPWVPAGMRLTLCGLRRSEVLGLDWRRVDLDAGIVTITASRVKTGRGTETEVGAPKKSNSWRTVDAETLHPGTRDALLALWESQGCPDSGLVISDAAGEPVKPDAYSARFRSVCTGAGLPVLRSVHNVRHSLATALQAAGVPDHQAAALLGHDVQTYRRFYCVTDDDGAAAAAKVGGQVFAPLAVVTAA